MARKQDIDQSTKDYMTNNLEPSKENLANKSIRPKIVLIDSDEILCNILTKALEKKDYDVHFFTKGKEAREYLSHKENSQLISLIIIERLLPDMDGINLLDELVGKYKYRVPIIITSTLTSEKDIIEGIKNGAIDYITKPFSLPVFITKLDAFIVTFNKIHG